VEEDNLFFKILVLVVLMHRNCVFSTVLLLQHFLGAYGSLTFFGSVFLAVRGNS